MGTACNSHHLRANGQSIMRQHNTDIQSNISSLLHIERDESADPQDDMRRYRTVPVFPDYMKDGTTVDNPIIESTFVQKLLVELEDGSYQVVIINSNTKDLRN
tara:strand:- start:888 stop:1196 length:309 start_codon:yes stop_codon:yes gene_type:complete